MLLTSSELGKKIGIGKNTILRMANAGKIPAFKLDNERGDFRFGAEGRAHDLLDINGLCLGAPTRQGLQRHQMAQHRSINPHVIQLGTAVANVTAHYARHLLCARSK